MFLKLYLLKKDSKIFVGRGGGQDMGYVFKAVPVKKRF